jgi:type VI secretion system protein ImpM
VNFGATDPAAVLPGWFGKLPSLGDFASRRLDPAFIECWDAWLADGLLALRQQQPDTWLDAYLQAPSWCFLLMPGCLPGALGRTAWAGVLMPSVDRVGRYFPFTLALPLPALSSSEECWQTHVQALWPWLARLDDLAADALQDDWTVDRLEAELARLGGLELAGAEALAAPTGSLPSLLLGQPGPALELAAEPAAEAAALWTTPVAGRSYWLAAAAQNGPQRWVCAGLPESAAALLGGRAAG